MCRVCIVTAMLLSAVVVAEEPAVVWDNPTAKPVPHPDATGRAGQWWWPEQALENDGDSAKWGNGGMVFRRGAEAPIEEPTVAPLPPIVGIHSWGSYLISNILFEFDSADLSDEAKSELDKLADCMMGGCAPDADPDEACVIVGNTCDIGAAEYNRQLGQRRAQAVRDYLISKGVAPERLTAVSRGEENPAVPNDGPRHRQFNRRVSFKLDLTWHRMEYPDQ